MNLDQSQNNDNPRDGTKGARNGVVKGCLIPNRYFAGSSSDVLGGWDSKLL